MRLFDLTGKVAIVTGGNSGIGLGVARGLSEAGATVAIAARNESKSVTVVKELETSGAKAFAVECDVTHQSSIQSMVQTVVERCGRIDILVNNAGTTVRKRPEDLSFEEWKSVLSTNLDSAFLCSTACYPMMKQGGSGKILNNGSMLSLFGSPWSSAYAASKGGLVQLTKSLATAWAEDNIQVNCFLPGWIDTPLTVEARQQVDGLNEKVLARTPAKRWGHIDDFRGIAVFLASAASDFITGTVIPVDGGFSVNAL
jgi:2-dehydro-3-deoxy-D-gluconate 5-dehydrogenase